MPAPDHGPPRPVASVLPPAPHAHPAAGAASDLLAHDARDAAGARAREAAAGVLGRDRDVHVCEQERADMGDE